MAADFLKPVLSDAHASVLASVRDLASDIAKMLDSTGTQNIPVNAVRWSSANARWEKYNGSTWAALATQYAIDVATVGGKSVGNANGNVPLSNGTVNTNLNADLVDGFHASQARNAANSAVVRDTNGYIQTDYLNTVADVTATAPSHFAVQTGSDNYVRWRTLAAIKADLGVGAAASNIGAAGTYGGFSALGVTNGYSGFRFDTADSYLMHANNGETGEYSPSAGVWRWRFDNGTLATGTVPWARLSGVPAMNYLPLDGSGSMTGSSLKVNGASAGWGGWNYAVQMGAASHAMIHGSTGAMGIGFHGNRTMYFADTSAGAYRAQLDMTTGNFWTSAYGWLHDYFATTANVNTKIGNCAGASAAIGGNTVSLVRTGNNLSVAYTTTNCNCNCDCSC